MNLEIEDRRDIFSDAKEVRNLDVLIFPVVVVIHIPILLAFEAPAGPHVKDFFLAAPLAGPKALLEPRLTDLASLHRESLAILTVNRLQYFLVAQ